MKVVSPTLVYFVPCSMCPGDSKSNAPWGCNGHDPSTVASLPSVPQPPVLSFPGACTEARAREIAAEECAKCFPIKLDMHESEARLRGIADERMSDYGRTYLESKMREIASQVFQAWHPKPDEHVRAMAAEIERISKERDEAKVALAREQLRAHKLAQSLEGKSRALDQIAEHVAYSADPGVAHRECIRDILKNHGHLIVIGTPAAPCVGLESERPSSKAPAPPAEQSDRSLSDCPICKLSVPEAREYARKAINFALADCAYRENLGSITEANKRNAARKEFDSAKEALANAPR